MVTTGFTVNGIMADIGHLRHLRWVQDDDPASPINQPPSGSTSKAGEIAKQRWISYNRMRGQYASAMEHATPEQFFVDKNQCGNANQPACQQAISAVKALQIAAQEGQKIYTITQANFSSALPKISLSSAAREEIRNAVAAGKEVTIHERPIHAFGWSGSGYAVVDPETGAGAYMIEGGANGSYLDTWNNNGTNIGLGLALTSLVAAFATTCPIILLLLVILSVFVAIMNMLVMLDQAEQNGCPVMGELGAGLEGVALIIGFFGVYGLAIGTWLSFLIGGAVGSSVKACKH